LRFFVAPPSRRLSWRRPRRHIYPADLRPPRSNLKARHGRYSYAGGPSCFSGA